MPLTSDRPAMPDLVTATARLENEDGVPGSVSNFVFLRKNWLWKSCLFEKDCFGNSWSNDL